MKVGVSVCLGARLLFYVFDARFCFTYRCEIDTLILACLRLQKFRVSEKGFGIFGNRFFDAHWCLMVFIFYLFLATFDYYCDVGGLASCSTSSWCLNFCFFDFVD